MTEREPDYWRYRPHAPAPGRMLGASAEIEDGQAKEYRFGAGVSAFRMIVIRLGSRFQGYLNLCPHFSLPLNRYPDQFVSADGRRLRCSQHFAEFDIESGICVSGACLGEALDRIPVSLTPEGGLLVG